MHENVISDNINVNFTQILDDSLNLNIYFYTPIVIYRDFLKFKNEINIIILNILDKEGIKLAYPTKNIIINNNEQ